VTIEAEFWQGLKEIARRRRMTVSELVGFIDSQRQHNNLSSALRLFVLWVYRSQIPDAADRGCYGVIGVRRGQAAGRDGNSCVRKSAGLQELPTPPTPCRRRLMRKTTRRFFRSLATLVSVGRCQISRRKLPWKSSTLFPRPFARERSPTVDEPAR
jgi:hypothetical protein